MFKRKASTEEQAAAKQEEQVELAIVNLQGGFMSTSEEHQANRARMVLQATDFAVYHRLKKGSIPSRRNVFTYVVAVYEKSVAEKILNREITPTDTPADARVTRIGSARRTACGWHEVEGTLEVVQTSAWSQEEEEQNASYTQEYTVIILENKIESINVHSSHCALRVAQGVLLGDSVGSGLALIARENGRVAVVGLMSGLGDDAPRHSRSGRGGGNASGVLVITRKPFKRHRRRAG